MWYFRWVASSQNFQNTPCDRQLLGMFLTCSPATIFAFQGAELCSPVDFQKTVTSLVTRYQILRQKSTKFEFGWGSVPDGSASLQRLQTL